MAKQVRDKDQPRGRAKDWRPPPGATLKHVLRVPQAWIGAVAWSPDGAIVATASSDCLVRLWSTETGVCLVTLRGHGANVWSIAFSPTGDVLATGDEDGVICVWSMRSHSLTRKIRIGKKERVQGLSFCAKNHLLAAASGSLIYLWDSRNGKKVSSCLTRASILCGLASHPSEDIVIAVGLNGIVAYWNYVGARVYDVSYGSMALWDVCVDPTGRMVATAGSDCTVKLWDARTRQLLRTLEGHLTDVSAVAFSFGGRWLASKEDSGSSVIVWDCNTWEPAVTLLSDRAEKNRNARIAFHPRSLVLAVASGVGSGVVELWAFDPSHFKAGSGKGSISYTSAKVVLVGESNVGKSYLAHRIATGSPPTEGSIKSTHGMKLWPIEPERLGQLEAPIGERRDLVLWDMGGQGEYRLIHQMFLHDTTAALVLLDPTRGSAAFNEVEAWDKSLVKQLRGRAATKLLVGAKVDQPSEMIDRQGLERLRKECDFAEYCETSAITGRGMKELCEAVGKAIDWTSLGKTTRPELFQSIRDEIELRRKQGVVAVLFDELDQELQTIDGTATFSLMAHEVAIASDAGAGTRALDAVCAQLAQQGVIVRARTSAGKNALILRVEEVERYAGSLILAARNNPRGVPALELDAIAREGFHLPEILDGERLPRSQERTVLECVVQLMLEHGICFQHEGLLIFPSLFAPGVEVPDENLAHAVSLYYDFAGAIDNIYASLVAWLVLAKEFGKLRLWADRAEFETKAGGLCGLRKVGRPSGFAHVDVYFEVATPEQQRTEFISFVEDHLSRNGVEIREHVSVKCACGHNFGEETLRLRIARGERDVACPVCEERHSLAEGAAEARQRDPMIERHTWALRTQIEKQREKQAERAVRALGKAELAPMPAGPIRLLHLSDLHFTKDTPVAARLQWLLDDLRQERGLGIQALDYLVITGDFTDKGCIEGFEKAYELVSDLTREFGLSAERCIFVPGNHDVLDLREAYDWRDKADGLAKDQWVQKGDIILVRNGDRYPNRLKGFSDSFYHKFLQRPYPLDCAGQGLATPFWETGIQFLTLNSCWQIDQFHRKRSGVHVEAVANVIRQAQKQEQDAQRAGFVAPGKPLLRIAVWHHSVLGREQMSDTEFLGNLQKNGVRLALHGDVHEMQREQVGHRREKGIHVIGSGSFGARGPDRPESTPRLYNVLEIARDLKSVRVHTRCQPQPDGPWDGWHEWTDPAGGKGRLAYYDVAL